MLAVRKLATAPSELWLEAVQAELYRLEKNGARRRGARRDSSDVPVEVLEY
jgi:hypothetical protein